MSRAVNWLLPLATLAVYLWLVVGHALPLAHLAGGLALFDLRVTGYTLEAARQYLTALPPEGHALYLGPVARLDTALPILLGLTLLWWMRPPTTAFGAVAACAALVYVLCDLGENRVVARLLVAGAEGLTPEMVAAASTLTRAKFMALALALVLAARAAWRRRTERGAG